MKTIPLFQRNMTDFVEPLNYRNPRRYENYMAIVKGLDPEGEEERTYLNKLNGEDLFFNAKDVKAYDIIIACCWDNYKRRKRKSYYIVLDITDDQMTLDDGHTTYLKTVKALKELRNELQNEETI